MVTSADSYVCTLPFGHDGDHVATAGHKVIATWPQPAQLTDGPFIEGVDTEPAE